MGMKRRYPHIAPISDRTDLVVLVDESDKTVGTQEKLQAHIDGTLHRAFSVFLFDSSDRILMQRRAVSQDHSGGLLTNACCSHPQPGEAVIDAARRRLYEEMGVETELTQIGSLLYQARLNGLIENEFDHLLAGRFDGNANPDPAEVEAWRWQDLNRLGEELSQNPSAFTPWFRVTVAYVVEKLGELAGRPIEHNLTRISDLESGVDKAIIIPPLRHL